MPIDADGMTKGFAFVEYHDAAEANAARQQTDGYKLDKAHVFKTSMYDGFAKFEGARRVGAFAFPNLASLFTDPL